MSTDRAAQLVEAGIWLKLSGDLEGARKLFERALKLDPANDKARQLLAGTGGAMPSGIQSAPPAPAPLVPHAPVRVEADWAAATGYRPSGTPAPTLESGWGRATPGAQVAMNVVLGDPTPSPPTQPAPGAPPADAEPPHRGPTMQFPRPAELSAEPSHRGPTMQFPRPVELGAEPAHSGPTMQFPRPAELGAEPAHTGPTMQFPRPPEVAAAAAEEPAHRGPTMQFARPADLAAAIAAEDPHRPRTQEFARPPELEAAIMAARAALQQAAAGAPQSPAPSPESAAPHAQQQPASSAFSWGEQVSGSGPTSAPEPGPTAPSAAPAPAAWDVPSWDTAPVAPAPAAVVETPRGGTMQFARPPELEAAIRAARATLQIEPMGAPLDLAPVPAAPTVDATSSAATSPSATSPAAMPDVGPHAGAIASSTVEPVTPEAVAPGFAPPVAAMPGVTAEPVTPAAAMPGVTVEPTTPEALAPVAAMPALTVEPATPVAPVPVAVTPPSTVEPVVPAAPMPVAPAERGSAVAASAQEPSAWDVPAWDLSPAAPVAAAPPPVAVQAIPRGGTMQFAAPPELADAIRAARAALKVELVGAPLELSAAPAAPPVEAETATSAPPVPVPAVVETPVTGSAPIAATPVASVPVSAPATTEPSAWDVPAWDLTPAPPVAAAPPPVAAPEIPRGGTMQFAAPPELASAIAAARATLQAARQGESSGLSLQIEPMGALPEVVPVSAPPVPSPTEPTLPPLFGAAPQVPVAAPPAPPAPAPSLFSANAGPAEVSAWDVPAWDASPAVAPAPAPVSAPPVPAAGGTMVFARPPELTEAIKASRTMAFGVPPEVKAAALVVDPAVASAPAPQPGGLPPGPVRTMQFARSPELVAALGASRGATDVPPAVSAEVEIDVEPMLELDASAVVAEAPSAPRGSTMQFARPPELSEAIAAARAQLAAAGKATSSPAAPAAAVPAPVSSAPRTSTMMFARPPEVSGSRTTGQFAKPTQPQDTSERAGAAAQAAAAQAAAAQTAAAQAAAAQAAAAQAAAAQAAAAQAAAAQAAAAQAAAAQAATAPDGWSEAVPSPAPAADSAAPGSSDSALTFPVFVDEPSTSDDVLPWDTTAPALPAAPAPESWTNSPAPSGPRSTQQLFRDSSITHAAAAAKTIALAGEPEPEPPPHSTPPLFGYTAAGHPHQPQNVTLGEPAAQSQVGMQALGAMLGSGGSSPVPSSPPLFTGPAVAEGDPAETADPMGFAWAWSGSNPPPRSQDADLPLVPRPSPAFAPKATSAWDARSNPGLKLDSAVGEDRALELISSDSKVTAAPPAQKDLVPGLLKSARALLDLDDHSGAMELILKAQNLAPNDPDVKAMRERSERTLLTMFESKLGKLETMPRVLLKDDEIIWLNLDHRAGFVLAQIDGTVSFDDLFSVSGMSRIDTARILAQLVEEGVISRG